MTRPKVLAVDDDGLYRDVLSGYLTMGGYDVIAAEDGDTALQLLNEAEGIDVIVLDRMMPRLDGIEVLKAVKADPRFADIPVVMQSAATARSEIVEGIKAGAYYYLSKPYDNQVLLAVVARALRDADSKKMLRDEVAQYRHVIGLMSQSCFRFRTLTEARTLALLIANCFPQPELAVYGLNELLVNAIEHGNLGIGYNEKKQFMLDGRLLEEIDRRLALPENRDKWAFLCIDADHRSVRARIIDQGQGFDWRKYMELSPERATDPHGRGIATSRMLSFTSVEYFDRGNDVICTLEIPQAPACLQ